MTDNPDKLFYRFNVNRNLGLEAAKSQLDRLLTGFFDTYMSGNGLDIGYQGHSKDNEPILNTATGVDLNYPGYNGLDLPFETESQDYVFSSHTLEHIYDWERALKEWFRVVKIGGHIIIIVPHQYLYERKKQLPSKWAGVEHKRFYTPSVLMTEIEHSLTLNSYRIREFYENDTNYNYEQPLDKHPEGCYEIVCVIEKIKEPKWVLED